jgi:putative iron-dependent peroxidase
MPFGSPATQFGTYFIGYSRRLGDREDAGADVHRDPPGLHDRLLDFSTPLTGSTFFVPSADVLDGLGDSA